MGIGPFSKLAVEPRALAAVNPAAPAVTIHTITSTIAVDGPVITGLPPLVQPAVVGRDAPSAPSGFVTSVIASTLTAEELAAIPTKAAGKAAGKAGFPPVEDEQAKKDRIVAIARKQVKEIWRGRNPAEPVRRREEVCEAMMGTEC
ncbi:Hypothetical protein D9617_9g024350 [Elsinoe fawcettii]|nr:Hypothetical protein D9617_9g024350 [Elsinoe fawcettii]